MATANTRTMLQELAEWACALRFEDIPPRVVEKAKLQILSVLGAIHSGARTRAGKILCETARSIYGPGNSILIPSGERVSISAAAFCWAGLSVSQDYDCYLLFGHTGHSAVSASLLTGELLGSAPREILAAQIIANEIEGRIGASVLLGPHNGQGWSFIHLIGAAAAGSRLLGLSPEKTAHAMAISFYQPTYVLYPGFMGPDSKLLTGANPTMVGLQAAFLAQKGFTGALDILENQLGFFNQFAYYPLTAMVSGLGKQWVTDTLAYKIYPGCAYIDTTVDAVFEIMRRYEKDTGEKLTLEKVAEVLVEATGLTVEMDRLSKSGISFDPLNPVSVNFSIPGNVALALIHGRLTGAELTDENLARNAEQVKSLASRVTLEHNLGMTVEMVRQMEPALKISGLVRTLSIRGLLHAQKRINRQYGRRMGLERKDVLKFLREQPASQHLSRAGRILWKLLGSLFTSRPGWSLGDADLENFTMPFSARVKVTLADGKVYEHRQDIPNGGPGQALELRRELVLGKFCQEASPGLGTNRAKQVSEKVLGLENVASVKNLLEECCEGKS